MLLLACVVADPPARPNLVLVSMDTLRADRLGAWGNADRLTPSLDRFAAEAVVFPSAWAQSSQTLFSHASLFTSRYPSELGAVDYSFDFPAGVPTLAGVLATYGYRTGAFVAGGHLSPEFGLTHGFSTWDSPVDWGSLWHTGPRALAWIDTLPAGEPFFTFVHGYDTHHRYLKPEPWGYARADPRYDGPGARAGHEGPGTSRVVDGFYFRDQKFDVLFQNRWLRMRGPEARAAIAAQAGRALPFRDEDTAWVRGAYDGAVSWADTGFGLFMAGLAARGRLEDSVVVVVSDHGEELGEDGVFNHRLDLSEATLHVPMMVRAPGVAPGRVEDLAALLDVAPTLWEAAGAVLPAEARGRSWWGRLHGEPATGPEVVFAEGVYRQVAARSKGAMLRFDGPAAHSPMLADLMDHARDDGPAWVTTDRSTFPAMKAEMLRWRRSISPSPAAGDAVAPERVKLLREQGYFQP